MLQDIQTRLHSTLPAHPPATLNMALSLSDGDLGSRASLSRVSGAVPRRGLRARLLISLWPPGDSEPQRQWAGTGPEVRGAYRWSQAKGSWREWDSNAPAACDGATVSASPIYSIHKDRSRMGATRQLTQPRSATSKARTSPGRAKSRGSGRACTWRTLLSSGDGESPFRSVVTIEMNLLCFASIMSLTGSGVCVGSYNCVPTPSLPEVPG